MAIGEWFQNRLHNPPNFRLENRAIKYRPQNLKKNSNADRDRLNLREFLDKLKRLPTNVAKGHS